MKSTAAHFRMGYLTANYV